MRKNIMIVEDDSIIRMLLKNIIKRMSSDVNIIECQDGRDALINMADNINLIFSDNNMPFVSGFELMEKIKADNRFNKIPIVMVSVEARKEYISMGIKKGFSDWIIKPFQPDQIAKCLEKYT